MVPRVLSSLYTGIITESAPADSVAASTGATWVVALRGLGTKAKVYSAQAGRLACEREEGADHRDHWPGRLLSSGAAAGEGVRGPRRRASLFQPQPGTDRPPRARPQRFARLAIRPPLRGHDRLRGPESAGQEHPAG